MTKTTVHPDQATSQRTARPPFTVWAALVLTTLVALVTSYGAVYFSLVWKDAAEPSIWTWLFAIAFVAIAVAGVVAAVGLVRGSNGARKALIAYALLGICFTIAKLIWWQETEALDFGGLDLGRVAHP